MKLEFLVDVSAVSDERVWRDALDELNAACATPWTLLSAGAPYDTFVRQAIAACQAGASGIIAGRAIWADAVALDGADRERFVDTVVRARLEQLAAICRGLATPWTRKVPTLALPPHWYASGRTRYR
jgi:tagatose 1,6-diphosphate aldolase